MRRARALLLALAGLLLFAAQASAATFTVNSGGDPGSGGCNATECTLEEAIAASNATPLVTDSIVFSVQTVTLNGPLPDITDEVAIEGGGAVTVTARGVTAPVLRVLVSDVRIAGVAVTGSTGNGIEVAATADRVVITQSPVFGNALEPIALAPGANDNTPAPFNLRIGPRQADGSLPIFGTTAGGGTVELFAGNPFGAAPIAFFTSFLAAGDFGQPLPADPPAGGVLGATFIGVQGTSRFTTVRVPNDIASPEIQRGRGVSENEIAVIFSEPVDPGSVQPEDIVFEMADVKREVTGIEVAPDGSSVRLRSNERWEPGEAGLMRFTAPGVVNDFAGNVNVGTPRVRVAAAPGDITPPVASRLSVKPRSFCVQPKRCRRTGTSVTFRASEDGEATLAVYRGRKKVGEKPKRAADFGRNRVRFDGRLRARRLRPGSYRLAVILEDNAGNVATRPPRVSFRVKRPTR